MLISDAMNQQMNEQIGHEFGASLQYLHIAAYFDNAGLPVLTQHFFRQAGEEHEHAMKFASAEEAVALALEWEYAVTKQINALLDRAAGERDHGAHGFLDWFAREQLEEVSSMDTLLKMIRRTGEAGLMLVENALASRRAPGPGGPAEES